MTILLPFILAAGLSGGPAAPPLQIPRGIVKIVLERDDTDENGEPQHDFCTGFVVDAAKGYVLTARHCVNEKQDMYVAGQPSHIIRMDENFALVWIEPMSLPPLEIRKGLPDVGEPVISYGYGYEILQVVHRYVSAIDDGEDVILDGPLAPGMSGGPVIDNQGRVVGVNQATTGALGITCGPGEIRAFLKKK